LILKSSFFEELNKIVLAFSLKSAKSCKDMNL